MTPTVLSPASPTELLQYIVSFNTYPTTLLICFPKEDFITSLNSDIDNQVAEQGFWSKHPLLQKPLFQVATARHIRIIFIPTVIHLRANLSVFPPKDSKIGPPPAPPQPFLNSTTKESQPLLLVYGFLDIHRDSSEWSTQGLGTSAALLVEAAQRTGFRPVMVEPKRAGGHGSFQSVLHDDVPILSGSLRRDGPTWMQRTVEVRRVLGRWFRFQKGQWDVE